MKKLTKISLSLIIFMSVFQILIFHDTNEVKAQEITPQQTVKSVPGSTGYIFKRLTEKLIYRLTPKSKKINYLKKTTQTRIEELKYLVNKNNLDQIMPSSSRYSYYAGTLTDQALSSDNQTKDGVIEMFTTHSKVLSELRDKFPANGAYWLSFQQNIDTLKILTQKLK